MWIFSSTDNSHYNYNSRYLFEYVKDNLLEITSYFVINDEKLRRKLGEEYGEQYFIETCSEEGMKKVLSAGVWFTSAGLQSMAPYFGKQDHCKSVARNSPEKDCPDGPQSFLSHRIAYLRKYSQKITPLC